METKILDSWNNFTSNNFLKPEMVQTENTPFIVINIEAVTEKDTKGNDITKPRLMLENSSVMYEFDLNKTNSSKLKELGIQTPRQLLAKKIYFKKVLVRNPASNKEVDGLRVWKVE